VAEHGQSVAAEHEEGRLDGAGGVGIFWQAWRPPAIRAVVVLAHGGSEHSGRYAWTAERLAERGYRTYAIDHRGHGKSEGPRAYIDRMDNAVADLDQLVDMAHSGGPLFLLGHSMGGLVALAYTARHQEKLDGLVLSAPLAALEAASPVQRVAGRVLSAVAPKLGVIPIDSSKVSRDPAVVKDYDTDPLNHHGKLPARTVAELASTIAGFPDAVSRMTLPMLVMHGTADTLVPPMATDMIEQRAGSDDLTVIRYEGLYHELLNEPERDRVAGDIADWLDAHTSD
jgi:acylglycerol lipase